MVLLVRLWVSAATRGRPSAQRHFDVDANLAGAVVFWYEVTSNGHFLVFGHEVVWAAPLGVGRTR